MSTPAERSTTVTFLVTDIVGSTEQLELLGDEEAVAITTGTISRLTQIAGDYGGELVKNMGDGIMCVFPSVIEAVTAGVAMQRALSSREDAVRESRSLPVRIGIHAGEPMRIGDDYFGMAVNVVVKMCHRAGDNQIVVSDLVRGLVGNRGEFAFAELGEWTLSGLSTPVRAWEVLWTAEGVQPGAGRKPTAQSAREARVAKADREPETVVILFVDVVDSVPHTERLGDAGFRARTRELDTLLRGHVREHRGTAVDGKLVGDGVLAIFPSARSAIACAMECGTLGASVDLELHLGIHAGDVIRDGNNIYGGAVNIASRISDATKPGEILLSDTVRGLARTSGGVSFKDCGEYMLKGIDEPVRLYTVGK